MTTTGAAFRSRANEARERKIRIFEHRDRVSRLSPLTEAEAQRLIAEHIQTKGITTCEPAYADASSRAMPAPLSTYQKFRAAADELRQLVKEKEPTQRETEEARQRRLERNHAAYNKHKALRAAQRAARATAAIAEAESRKQRAEGPKAKQNLEEKRAKARAYDAAQTAKKAEQRSASYWEQRLSEL